MSDVPASASPSPGLARKVLQALRGEVEQLRPRVVLVSFLGAVLPGARVGLLRLAGFSIGEGTQVDGMPRLTGGELPLGPNLVVGRDCHLEAELTLELGERLTLHDGVRVGRRAMILTTSHELGPREHRAGPITRAPVTIERGAVLGARCIVLPGVTVGEGAVVEPGAVVNKSVAAHTRVAGTPARPVLKRPSP
ncbi:acyltransferase [Aggregicoccus sp. 17bor-14]|uniref:acyltransferase n=1 Tax=Myxococcaceae TaxID=31 RepID=UPI00129D0E0B|nr:MULTISPECIES: acyltransferase [Myxococcaceae]MBF5044834.1 acyltransferase [Simulacricoccus sp. 17bor-14]MRI90578.1 acyltransferase [Aggregicoccus sp. 17bor-14]